MNNTFFERLERLMFERRIGTQKKLAEITGIDNGTISRWKRDKVTPQAESLKKLSDALGCSVEYLKEGNGPAAVTYTQGDTATGHIAAIVKSPRHTGDVRISHDSPGAATPELTPREQALIIRLRRYAPQAMWERIEADLDELERRYG